MTWTATASPPRTVNEAVMILVTYTDGANIVTHDFTLSSSFDFTNFAATVSSRQDIISALYASAAAFLPGVVQYQGPTVSVDPRANRWIILNTFDLIAPAVPKTAFLVTDTIGFSFTVMTAPTGGTVVPYSGTQSVPIWNWFNRSCPYVKSVSFTAGISSSYSVLASVLGYGIYGIDDNTSLLAHATQQQIFVQAA